jgi:PAS domain S-box-containing protein
VDRGFLDGKVLFAIDRQGIEFVIPLKSNMTATTDARQLALANVGRIFQVRSFPLKNQDGTIGKLSQLKDITKARRLEGEIEDYATQHRAIVDSANLAHLGIFIVQDHNGYEARFRYANKAFRTITGYSSEELLGKSILDLVHPDSIQKVSDRYRRRQRGEAVDHAYEIKMFHKNGQPINVFISAAISSYDGKVATIGFLQDFTDRRRFEKTLWMSQKLASIGRLAAEVAHEINNPLTSVLAFAKLMDRICGQEPFPLECLTELRQFIAFLDSEATRCGEIDRNLPDFSRHGDIDLKENDLHEILEKTLDVLRHRAQMNNIHIETSYNRDIPPLVCDFKRLQQAFVNLFWNAIEAMPEGGSLSVATSFDGKKEVVRLTISDTGMGISEENLDSIFEPFFTTKADGKGVGLGLSVAYGIIRQHCGTTRAQSNVGRGTSFTVEFKLSAHIRPHSLEDLEISKGEEF